MTDTPLLQVRDLVVSYHGAERSGRAVDGLSFEVKPGEALALVGESGCGKSTTALALTRLLPGSARSSGAIRFDGRELTDLPESDFRPLRGAEIGMIFQEPMTSLNPVLTIGDQIGEVLTSHGQPSRAGIRARVLELLAQVGLPDPERRIHAYPHELSGGQRQRVVIAIAIALNPRLLIADEPTTALDTTTQLQILELLDRLRRELNMALVLISHDLSVVSRWTDRVIVMHHGQAMEQLASASLFGEGQHPYTRGLISASVRLGDDRHYTSAPLAEIRTLKAPDGAISFVLGQPEAPRAKPAATGAPLLEIRDLVVDYSGGKAARRAVDGVSLTIARGETLGLVGESGCGKSSLSRAILRLVDPAAGQIRFDGQEITRLKGAPLRALRPRFQMVFQDPFGSLNLRHQIGDILGGVLKQNLGLGRAETERRVGETLDQVGLPQSAALRYPHEFSGGQRQRIAIARALILRPELVVLDEPVSALDVSVQAQILNLLAGLKAEFGLSYLFITHDLAVVQYISDRVAVMQSGKIVEESDPVSIWRRPQHPHTRELIASA